jgi:hypothetical protein
MVNAYCARSNLPQLWLTAAARELVRQQVTAPRRMLWQGLEGEGIRFPDEDASRSVFG